MASRSNFSSLPQHRCHILLPRHVNQSYLHEELYDAPKFDGRMQPEAFVDWLHRVEQILDHRDVFESHRVRFVAKRLKGHAFVWWENLKNRRKLEGRSKIVTWSKMKRKLLRKYLPTNYRQDSYFQSHKQASSVNLWHNDDLFVTKREEEIRLNDNGPAFNEEDEIIYADQGDILPLVEIEVEEEMGTEEREEIVQETSSLAHVENGDVIFTIEESKSLMIEEANLQKLKIEEKHYIDINVDDYERRSFVFSFIEDRCNCQHMLHKLMVHEFIAHYWSEWMEVVTKVGKYKILRSYLWKINSISLRLRHIKGVYALNQNSRTNFCQHGEYDVNLVKEAHTSASEFPQVQAQVVQQAQRDVSAQNSPIEPKYFV